MGAAAGSVSHAARRSADHTIWRRDKAATYQVARYGFTKPALFLPLDGDNRRRLGLTGKQRPAGPLYAPYQAAALALHQRFGDLVHGLSWESFHRNQPGRVYALWHQHKDRIGLVLTTPRRYPRPVDDPE